MKKRFVTILSLLLVIATTVTTAQAATATSFSKEFTEECYGIRPDADNNIDKFDDVTKYSFREEVTAPYFIGRNDKSATKFIKNNTHDAVIYLGKPMYLTTAMDKNVCSVSIDDETVAKVSGNELIPLKQGTFTLTTYDNEGKKLEDIKFVSTTFNDSRNDIASATTFPVKDINDIYIWGVHKDLEYWKTQCSTLMDVSFYFQARYFCYDAAGEPEGNFLNGGAMEDWMWNNDPQTIFECNKGVCLQAAQMAIYLLDDDFEDQGVICVDGQQGHIFNWVYEDGKYYVFDFTDVISYNSWGRNGYCIPYKDFSKNVKVCNSLEEIEEYIIMEKVDTRLNYLVYMYSVLGNDFLPCNLNSAKSDSYGALMGEFEKIVVGYQDIVVDSMTVLHKKKGLNIEIRPYKLEDLNSRIVYGRYNLDESYKYYYDYQSK